MAHRKTYGVEFHFNKTEHSSNIKNLIIMYKEFIQNQNVKFIVIE